MEDRGDIKGRTEDSGVTSVGPLWPNYLSRTQRANAALRFSSGSPSRLPGSCQRAPTAARRYWRTRLKVTSFPIIQLSAHAHKV